MAKGIIGEPFTFTVLFLDGTNTPTNVVNPTIEAFYFTDSGQRVHVVPAGTVLPSSFPAETGRYAYTLVIPSTLEPSQQLYGIMRGLEPITSDPMVIEQEVDLFPAEEAGGLRASFVKDGFC